MLKLKRNTREADLRQSMDRRLRDLQEHVETRQAGVPINPGDVVAENLLQAGIAIDDYYLREELAARRHRPLKIGAWVAGIGGFGAGILTGNTELAVGTIGCVFVLVFLSQRRQLKQPEGATKFVHPFITPTVAYRLAAENERFTERALISIYGKDVMDRYGDDLPIGTVTTVQEIVFRPGEYPGLENQDVHELACRTLAMRVRNMDTSWAALPFHILHGDAGRGKTTLVKVLSQEVRDRLTTLGMSPGHHVEAFGGDLTKPKKLDAVVRLATSIPGSVLFIDEIHAIPPEIAERLYLMTDRDFRYKFEGDDFPTILQPFTIVGATTDLGKLHKAFRSRAQLLPLQLVPPERLVALALGMPYTVELEAAELVVSRVRWDGMPRAVVSLLELAAEVAKSHGRGDVTVPDVEEAIEVRQLDEWGLGPFHRDVVKALARSPVTVKRGTKAEHTVYKLSETSLLAMAKVDAVSFREDLRPALMDRGFMVTTSGGQQLTDSGLAYAGRRL